MAGDLKCSIAPLNKSLGCIERTCHEMGRETVKDGRQALRD